MRPFKGFIHNSQSLEIIQMSNRGANEQITQKEMNISTCLSTDEWVNSVITQNGIIQP